MSEELFADCTPCHIDVHWGQFASDKARALCKDCHDERGFKPSLFGPLQHQKSSFSLTGAHFAVPCSECHRPYPKEELSRDFPLKQPKLSPLLPPNSPLPEELRAEKIVRYKFKGHSCRGCHKNPHGKKYDSVIRRSGCSECHRTTDWWDIKKKQFDHNLTRFPLTGKHRSVSCNKCHRLEKRRDGRILPHFRPLARECSSCHRDVHAGQFTVSFPVRRCGDCHSTKGWKGADKFDHNWARFKLTGKHRQVECKGCHFPAKIGEGSVVVYRPIRHQRCIYCHENYHLRTRGGK